MNKKNIFFSVLLTAFFVTGNLVGAGILGLPVQAGFAGFVPCLAAVILVGFAMSYTAFVLGDEVIRTKKPKFHYPSLYQAYLGPVGKWLAVLAALVIYYGFLIAYLSGARAVIKELLNVNIPTQAVTVIFFIVVTALTIANPRVLRDYTAVFVALLLISFLALVFMGEKHIVPGRLSYMDWKFFPLTLPVMVTAFSFHVIIPNVCGDMGWKKPVIFLSMVTGAVIGYLVTVLWVQVTLGILPVEGVISISAAYRENLPSTVPLSEIIRSPQFIRFSLFFALMAIVTSYVTNGYGLMEFIDDLMSNYFRRSNKLIVILLSFLPPLAITLIYPDIFLTALDMAGAFGVAVLFGILPCVIAIVRARAARRAPVSAVVVFLIFLMIIVFKTGKETGMIKLTPGGRYEKYNFDHYVTRPPSDRDGRHSGGGRTKEKKSRAVKPVKNK
ncbi:MAG: aromatic amino acid transport family protein [Candidatus Omnitrophota bacterium]